MKQESFETLVNLLEIFIMTGFLTLYLKPKYKGIIAYACFFFGWMAGFAELCIVNSVTAFENLAAYIPVAIYFVYALLCLRGTVMMKLWMAAITQIVVLITAVVSNLGICLAIGYDPNDMITIYNPTRVAGVLLSKVILVAVYAVILRHRHDGTIESAVWYRLIIVPLTSVYAVMMLMSVSLAHPETRVTVFFSMVCIVIGNAAAYYFFSVISAEYRNRAKLAVLEQHNKAVREQIAGTEEFLCEMRVVRHDIKNHILTARQMLNDGKTDDAAAYLARLTDEYLPETQNDADIPNAALGAVLNAKNAACRQNGVTFDVHLNSMKLGAFDLIDAGIVFGNLLDNAYEAACASKERVMTLAVEDSGAYLSAIIGNSIDASVLAGNRELHTTKSAKALHGIGIESVETVVKKYDGIINFYEEDGRFYCHVLIDVGDSEKQEKSERDL